MSLDTAASHQAQLLVPALEPHRRRLLDKFPCAEVHDDRPGGINFLKDDPQFVALIMAAPFTTPQLPLPFDAPKLSLPFTSIKLSLAIYYP